MKRTSLSETELYLRGGKNDGIIMAICELYGISIQYATDMHYQSEASCPKEGKDAYRHCRSEKCLAALVWEEHLEYESKSTKA